jgi:lycopene cyclase domain-containing protein
MKHWSYMAMLAFTVVGSFWLELVLKVRVLKRFRRLFLSIAPIALLFVVWDAYAIQHGHWHFDGKQMLGAIGPFHIPLEEYLFFIIVPIAGIMTLEAVRAVKKDWPVGDGDDL